MLRSLRIENLVLIREAELSPAEGLSAITGETGAGKTILAQALGLLLGAITGLAGDRRQARGRRELSLLNEDEVLDPQATKQRPGCSG